MLHIFGEETKLTAAKFREKLLDIRQYFRKLADKVTTSTEPPSAELDDQHSGDDDDMGDESLEPIDAPDEQIPPPPEHDDVDPYAHERKPDYREETKKLIEGMFFYYSANSSVYTAYRSQPASREATRGTEQNSRFGAADKVA